MQAKRQVKLHTRSRGPTAGFRACAGRGGLHGHERRTKLGECLTRERQARARADAEGPDEAMPDSAGPRIEVGDPQVAAQEAQVHARQAPAAMPAELSTGCGAKASSVSKREIEPRELGDMRAFDMDVEGEPRSERAEEEQDSIADHCWQVGERADANNNDGFAGASDASQWRSLRTSQWRTAGSTT